MSDLSVCPNPQQPLPFTPATWDVSLLNDPEGPSRMALAEFSRIGALPCFAATMQNAYRVLQISELEATDTPIEWRVAMHLDDRAAAIAAQLQQAPRRVSREDRQLLAQIAVSESIETSALLTAHKRRMDGLRIITQAIGRNYILGEAWLRHYLVDRGELPDDIAWGFQQPSVLLHMRQAWVQAQRQRQEAS